MTDEQDRPAFAMLLDWLDGRLDPETATRVARQVEFGDRRTVDTVAWLQGVLDAGRSMPLETPPPGVREKLRMHFAAWRDVRFKTADSGFEIVADLFFDSRRHRVLSGVRGAGPDAAIHLAYGAGPIDIVVDVRPVSEGCVRLDGQVLIGDSEHGDRFMATAVAPGATIGTVDGDELGRFCLPEVPDTVTHLRVSNGDLDVVANLDIRSADRR